MRLTKKYFQLYQRPADLSKTQIVLMTLSAIVGASLLTMLVIVALFNRPIADDYTVFSSNFIGNFFSTIVHFFSEWTGRVGQSYVSLVYKVFGPDRATVIIPLLSLCFVWLSTMYLLHIITSRVLKKQMPLVWTIVLSMVSTSLIVLSANSLYDTYLWSTSNIVYMPGIAATITILATVINMITSGHNLPIYKFAILAFLVIASSFFNELVDVYMIGGFLMSIIVVSIPGLIDSKNYRKRQAQKILIVGLLSAIAGFTILYFSPGSSIRQASAGSDFSLYQVLVAPLANICNFGYLFDIPRLGLIILLGACIGGAITSKPKPRTLVVVLSCLAIFSIGVAYVFFAIMGYAQDSYIPLRAYVVPSSVIMICAVVVASVLSKFAYCLVIEKYPAAGVRNVVMIALSIASFAVVGGFLMDEYRSLLAATVLRSNLYTSRDLDVKQAILDSEDQKEIVIKSVPVLLLDTQAQDINKDSPEWLKKSFIDYYDIPSNRKIVYD